MVLNDYINMRNLKKRMNKKSRSSNTLTQPDEFLGGMSIFTCHIGTPIFIQKTS